MPCLLAHREATLRLNTIIKNRLFFILRLILASSLLLFLFQRIGLEEIQVVVSTVDPIYFVLLYGFLSLDNVMRSYNWNALLQTKSYHLPLREIILNYLVGGFFGTFIPSSLGTDVSRAYLLARRNHISTQDSVLTIVVLNIIGLLALCIIGLFSAFLLWNVLPNPTIALPIVLICLAYLVLFPFLLRGWMPYSKKRKLPQFDWLFAKIREFSTALRAFNEQRIVIIKITCIALLNQLLGIVTVYTVSLALRIDVPLHYFLAFVPIFVLSRFIPFSIAGLGGEQGVYVFMFSQVGVPYAEAFLISLIMSVTKISFSFLGGITYVLDSVYNLIHQESRSRM